MVEMLRRQHRLVLFAPAAAYEFLSNAYRDTEVQVVRIPGLVFHYAGKKLSVWRTLAGAMSYLSQLPRLVSDLRDRLRQESADVVITDFEPALPRAAGRLGIPVISLDHQHVLVAGDLSCLPAALRWKAAAMAPVIHAYCRGQVETIVSSFYFPPLRRRWEHIVQTGVLLRPEIINARPEDAGYLLAYFRRSASANMLESLQRSGREVRVYGLGALPRAGRLHFLPLSEHGFVEDLAGCTALISNAGNQLVGEALYLGKPVLAVPEERNDEQLINAHFLRQTGGGDWVAPHEWRSDSVSRFCGRLDDYRHAVDRPRICGNLQALAAVTRHLKVSTASLTRPDGPPRRNSGPADQWVLSHNQDPTAAVA
jgi:uncharacterized protein (TIGR00661 family)